MNSDIFNTELTYIKNDNLRKSAKEILNTVPSYFYEIPASSTGKYHPSFSQGSKGLVRHVKVATRIMKELLDNNSIQNYTDKEKDLLLISILIHDCLKSGLIEEKYTRFDHPILIANFVLDNKDKVGLTEEDALFIADAVKTHMGQWTTDYNGNEVLEKPKTKYQRFVHMCDYLASKKFLDVKFENNEII